MSWDTSSIFPFARFAAYPVTLLAVKLVPSVTLLASTSAPNVGAVLLAPEIIKHSESSPEPIPKFHVLALPKFPICCNVTSVFAVTFGMLTFSLVAIVFTDCKDITFFVAVID